jgi:hypothetical protein
MNPLADRPWSVRAALLGFLALVVLSAELPELHNHDAGTPGLYSEDCLLARLALPSWGLPALAPPTLPQPDALPDPDPPYRRLAVRGSPLGVRAPRPTRDRLSPTAH